MEKKLMALILQKCSRKLIDIIDMQYGNEETNEQVFCNLALCITMINIISEELDSNCCKQHN